MKIVLNLQFLICKKYREHRSTVNNCNFSKLQFFKCTSTVIPLHIFAVQAILKFLQILGRAQPQISKVFFDHQNNFFLQYLGQNNFGKKIPVFQVIFLCQEKQSLTAWSSQQSATASCFNAPGYLLILRGCLNLRILKMRLTQVLYFITTRLILKNSN